MEDSKLVLLVLSCDAYNDLWEDFFNLRDIYWPDCPYKWFLVTETADYNRKNVNIIKSGKGHDWAYRFRNAINQIDAQYFGVYLEDYFLYDRVDNNVIDSLIKIMEQNNITFINTSDVFYNCIGMKHKEYFKDHLIIIPNNRLYGISTESGIWERKYLLEKLGNSDYSAWQFEIDRVNEAKSEGGLGGFNLCDDRLPFKVSVIPVVIQGKIYPPSRKFFKNLGYEFLTKRIDMSRKQVFLFDLKMKASKIKLGKKAIKWIATKFLGVKFFT